MNKSAVYFLSGVRPAAEKLRLVSPSVSEEKDKKLAKSILQKIRNGHIVLFFLVLLSFIYSSRQLIYIPLLILVTA